MDEQTRKDIKTKAAISVVLGQRDQAQSQWADAAGEVAALQCELSDLKNAAPPQDVVAKLNARICELETTVKEKDEQIVEQSNTIVALRAQVNG